MSGESGITYVSVGLSLYIRVSFFCERERRLLLNPVRDENEGYASNRGRTREDRQTRDTCDWPWLVQKDAEGKLKPFTS